jgi:allantoin racemase
MKIWYQSMTSFERFKSYQKFLQEYVKSVADPGVQIEAHGTTKGVTGGEYRFMEFLFTQDILENGFKAEQEGFDAFTIGCALDSGLFQAREVLNIPVVGILETALLVACMMGSNFCLITPNEKMIPRIEEIVNKYRLRKRLSSIEYMDFKIPDLDRALEDSVIKEREIVQFTDRARKAIEAGSEVIVPVGAMVSLFLAKCGIYQIDGVPVLDAISTVVKMTEMVVKLSKITGTFVSRRLSFAAPPKEILQEVRSEYGMKKSIGGN